MLKIPSSVTQIEEDAFALYSDDDLFSKHTSPENANIRRVNDGITLIVKKGSFAAEYAEKNGIKVIEE